MNYFAMTDVGKTREHNEDNYLAKSYGESFLFAVFDGMGGAAAGETASALAKEEVERYFDAFFAEEAAPEPAVVQAALASAADRANFSVYAAAKNDPALSGMGTTMVAALCVRSKIYIANVGDSRAYLVVKEGALQVTHDHSFVQHLVDLGRLTPEEARHSSKRNIITRAIGVDKEVGVDVLVLEEKEYAGKTLLLCSDGLSGEVNPPELAALRKRHKKCETFAKSLIEAANHAGGHDNITVIVAEV